MKFAINVNILDEEYKYILLQIVEIFNLLDLEEISLHTSILHDCIVNILSNSASLHETLKSIDSVLDHLTLKLSSNRTENILIQDETTLLKNYWNTIGKLYVYIYTYSSQKKSVCKRSIMNAVQWIFLLLIPPSNLFHCHRLVSPLSKTTKQVYFFNIYIFFIFGTFFFNHTTTLLYIYMIFTIFSF